MTTRPRFESLDLADTSRLRDLAPARASELPRQQHALMSEWGGPPQMRSVYLDALSGAVYTDVISYRVPPGVTEVDVHALMYGSGTALFTTSSDSTGTRFRSLGSTGTGMLEAAEWKMTGGTLSADNGAESGRALIVRSAVAWEWTDVDITVVVDATAGRDLYVFGLVFSPIHIPR